MITQIIYQKSKGCRTRKACPSAILNRFVLLMIGCAIVMQGYSQADKQLALADQYFANGEYFTAAGLYGQYLQAEASGKYRSDFPLNARRTRYAGQYKNKTAILYQQAESFRLANYWAEASAAYKKCFEKDSVGFPGALYWDVVCQRSLGNYSKAVESLNRFFTDYNSSNEWYAAALNEKQTLQFVKTQMTKPDSGMYHVQKISTDFGDRGVYAPFVMDKNKIVITTTQAERVTPGTNPYHNRLFTASLADNNLQNKEPISIDSVDSTLNQGAACISPDNNHLYFTQWKKMNGQTISSIYFSTKTTEGWSKPQLLNTANEPGHNSKQPFCSADGKYLFFASDRTGGKGGFDIWYAPILADGTTGEAINAGSVNSPSNEQAPFYHHTTGTLVFASDRTPGMGGYDLYSAAGSVNDWKLAENMGSPVNSSRDDIYFYAKENAALLNNAIISSDRGSECCLATYAISKTSKQKLMAGMVQDCAGNVPLDSARVILKDSTGKSWQTITSADGKYSFDVSDASGKYQIIISKEKYFDKSTDISIEKVNESNWKTDTLQNATLCTEKKFVLKIENVVTLYFDFDKSDLKDRGRELLDSIYTVIKENPNYTVQVSGYTDGKGTVEYNKKLSDRRAKACADYLIRKGIDPARLRIASFGALFPVEMELINGRDNAEGRSKNRRALINIDKQ